MKKISSLLFQRDPYLDFDSSAYPVDMQGWGSNHPFFRKILEATRPSVIFEVGTWKGGSAIHMAQIARDIGLDVEIVCIDTWLGSMEHILYKGEVHDSLKYVNGYPTLYYTFLSNVVAHGLENYITPFPVASESAAVVLAHLGLRADFVYIDAAHEYEPAYRDISEFWKLLTDEGIMLCDDYGYCDVTAAACAFAAKMRSPLYASFGKAIISKKQNRAFHLELISIA